MSPKLQFQAIRLWHAALVGGFIVAYLTGDEDTYAMHLFSGWWVVGMVALRLLAAAFAPLGSPLRLSRPNRPKPMALAIAAALALAGAAAVSGVAADAVVWLEDLHEGIAEFSLWVALVHVAVAVAMIKGRKWLRQSALALVVIVLAVPAIAEPARDAILVRYAGQAKAENSAFAGFVPSRGEAMYRSRHAVNKDAASCSTCHTDDPARPGRHVKTGRAIEPMAVSANPKRFTDAEKVEERFTRDCQSILGRACTAAEKGDFVAFMASR